MACVRFKDIRFSQRSLALIDLANEIIEAYQAQGLRLTLRQLYYQFVTRNAITNEEKSYKNLGSVISDGRLAGLIDWDAIEDRVRVPKEQSDWPNVEALVEDATKAYRLPRWKGQDYYAELWVEKDALAGVLAPLARKFHVTLMVNRGYSSSSAMYESARRFQDGAGFTPWDDAGTEGEWARKPILFYLGDHDPSGEDMVRDIRERLRLFGADVEVHKTALTTAQVRRYRPPPNPAKMSDSRAAAYVEKHGKVSWEVDALPPEVLAQLVEDEFYGIIDVAKMDAVKAREKEDKRLLRRAAKRLTKREGPVVPPKEPAEPKDRGTDE